MNVDYKNAEQFESIARSAGFHDFDVMGNGCYADDFLQHFYLGWQASRRAISSYSEIPNSSDPASRQAVSVPEWTDINLRQPDEYQVVLWFCQGGNIRTGMYYGKNHCDRVPETHPISGKGRPHYGKFGRYAEPAESGYIATHWMPLPKPPKQEQGR